MSKRKAVSTQGTHELIAPTDKLDDLSVQLQCFTHAPTREAWDIIWELYTDAEVRKHAEFSRVEEKIKMFLSLCLGAHSEWAELEEQKALLAQAQVRRDWVLSESGESKRKLDHIWQAYFATGDEAFPRKVLQIANNVNLASDLRETAVWSYSTLCEQCFPALANIEGSKEVLQMAAYLGSANE